MTITKIILISLFIIFLGFGYLYINNQRGTRKIKNNTEAVLKNEPIASDKKSSLITTIVTGLEIPWEFVFLPDGQMLVTERPGRVRLIDKDFKLNPSPILKIDEVVHAGEGGLMGMALHPKFNENGYIYFYYTFAESDRNTKNRVVRYKFLNNQFSEAKIIVNDIPGALFHNGGRIKFGPDGNLYISTGDSQQPSLSQDKNSLAGKILRITDGGEPIDGNIVYSYGHRNPQGLVWDNNGQLWATEHGNSTRDEINKIESAKNYGWPTIQGDQTQSGMEKAVINSGSGTWAPSGASFFEGSIYFGGLRGQGLFKYEVETGKLTKYFDGEFGRIRNAVLGPDGNLYILTNNRDGRGTPTEGDDRIIRIDPKSLD